MPGDANLSPHLQIDVSDTRVQASTHEKVIDEVSGHSHWFAGNNGSEVYEERNKPTPEHGDSHKVAEVVDDAG